MIGDGSVEARLDPLTPQHIDEEADQLVAFVGEALGLRRQVRLVGEQLGIVLGEHAGAGAARRDDIVAIGEGVDRLARDRLGVARSPEL